MIFDKKKQVTLYKISKNEVFLCPCHMLKIMINLIIDLQTEEGIG